MRSQVWCVSGRVCVWVLAASYVRPPLPTQHRISATLKLMPRFTPLNHMSVAFSGFWLIFRKSFPFVEWFSDEVTLPQREQQSKQGIKFPGAILYLPNEHWIDFFFFFGAGKNLWERLLMRNTTQSAVLFQRLHVGSFFSHFLNDPLKPCCQQNVTD